MQRPQWDFWVGKQGLYTHTGISRVSVPISLLLQFSLTIFVFAGTPKHCQVTLVQQETQYNKLYKLTWFSPNLPLRFLFSLVHHGKIHLFNVSLTFHFIVGLWQIYFGLNLKAQMPPLNNSPLSTFVILSSALQRSKT